MLGVAGKQGGGAMSDWAEESGFEVNPAVVKELYPDTLDEAIEAIRAARTLGFGVQFRNR